jgi:Na+-transporting NADH:ubiquinone oxidoreductase subunit C
MPDESTRKTLLVALLVAMGCSFLVSLTAVGLAERQQVNRNLDLMKNVVIAADLYDPDVSVEEVFGRFELRIVDLETGDYVTSAEIGNGTYDQRSAAGDPERTVRVPSGEDIAGLGRREKYSYVGLLRDSDVLDLVILPVRGQGLWSTMYGFLALEDDLTTVRGLTFYEHGETAGLGGEINNPRWRALWPGKRIYDDSGDLKISVVKGIVDPSETDAVYRVDGLSGATITADGVTHLLRYWLGDGGFRPYLSRLRKEEGLGDG